MKSFLFYTLLISMMSTTAVAQSFQFGQVSTNELSESMDSVFNAISAKVIYKKITIDYWNELEIHERVKIYNEDGFEYSNWEIYSDDITHLQAFTYNLKDDVIQKTHVTKENIIKENVFGDYEITKITFPNVRKGSVIEIKYKLDRGRLEEVPIQVGLPVRNFKLVVKNVGKWMEFKQNPNFHIELDKEVSADEKEVVFTGKDIPPQKDAPFVNNLDNYSGKLFIKNSNVKEDEEWGKLTGRLNRAFWFGQQLDVKPFYKRDIQKIIKHKSDSLQIAKSIYNYVRQYMEYNGMYSIGSYDLKDVYKSKVGNKASINLILTSMLRFAGFEANPMIIGCKHQGEVMFAELSSFNVTICALQIGEEFYLLDASEKYAKFGMIPLDLINGYGLIIRDDGTSISYPTRTNMLSASKSIINAEINTQDNSVKGVVKNQLSNYFSWEYREALQDESEESAEEALESGFNFLQIDNFTEKDAENVDEPVVISYDFLYEEAVEEIGGDLYIEPFLFYGVTENLFNEEERLYPLDIEHPFLESYSVNFRIPEGYKVENLPTGKNVIIEDDIGFLKFNSTATNSNIQLSLNVSINYSLIPTVYYQALKALYNEYVRISKSKIVLSKK